MTCFYFARSIYDVSFIFLGPIGPVWALGGETQIFYLAPDIEKTYAAKKPPMFILIEHF